MELNVLDSAAEMFVQLWDEDTLDDDLICEGKISLAQLCVEDGTDDWYEL